MTDIAIKPIDPFTTLKQKTMSPVYLVQLQDGKHISEFIATKFEDCASVCPKFVGFFSESVTQNNFQTILEKTRKDQYIEVIFPWHRIRSITNLIFKQK